MKIKNLILLFFLTVALTTCKKDYPDDIPQWIKDKIKECKRGNCCYDGAGMEINCGYSQFLCLVKNKNNFVYSVYFIP